MSKTFTFTSVARRPVATSRQRAAVLATLKTLLRLQGLRDRSSRAVNGYTRPLDTVTDARVELALAYNRRLEGW